MEKPKILYNFFPFRTLEDVHLLTNAIYGYSNKNNIKFLDYIELDKLTAPFYQQNNCVIMANGRSVDDALEHPLIRFFKLRFGIIPLFANCSNYYVWNRYAGGYDTLFYSDKFNGMCIGFKTNGVFKEARKVEYVEKPKVIDITEKFNKFKDYFKKDNISYEDEEYKQLFNALKDEVKESFFYKSKYWRHEQEYRIVKEFPYLNEQEEFELIEEIINADFGEIASVDKCYRATYRDVFFEYSHEEIACLITGCDLEKKCLEIFNKYLKQYNNDYEDFINSLIKSENVLEKMHENKKIFKKKINVKLIKESNKIINDMLLKFEENINKKNINEQLKKDINEYLKLIEYIMQTITNENDKENEEYDKSHGIFIAFYQQPQNILINLIPEVRGIFKFYLFELKFKRELTEIFGEKNVEKIIKYIFEEKIYDKDILKKNYYIFVLEYVYSKIKNFFKNINKLKNIENYKNNPEKLEEDIKDFCKNNPEKFKNTEEIKKLAKDISKIIEFISNAESKSELSFIYSSYYQKLYHSLNLFFINKLEKINKEFYEKFKNIDFKYLEEVKDNDRFYELH